MEISSKTPSQLMTSHLIASQKMTDNSIAILQTQKMMPNCKTRPVPFPQTQTMILILSQMMILILSQILTQMKEGFLRTAKPALKATSPQTVIQSSQKSQPSQPRSQLSQPLIRTDRIYVLPNMTQSR